MKRFLRIFVMFIAFTFVLVSLNVNAEELTTDLVGEGTNVSESNEQANDEVSIVKGTVNEGSPEVNNGSSDTTINEIHKVSVIINKTDEEGKSLSGATIQIIDADGNVVDEWVSDGSSHEVLLPEGNYVLHEVSAPEGYIKASDKAFTVKVEVVDLDAGVDWSETPCEHYGGTPLYYVDFNGQKEEVYCINQDWETPDENSNYDGKVLTPEEIKNFTEQTVYVDAEQNTERKDISDQSLTSQELYDKILDIIYHRQLATDLFSDLSEAEIRYITESALKYYTNAGLTRVQAVRSLSSLPENVNIEDVYYDGRYYWYLYTHFRSYIYLPDAPLGSSIYTISVDNGDAFGTIARHWNDQHGAKNSEEIRAKLARYYELYQYLISDENHHPSDMYLYLFSSDGKALDSSAFNFDEGVYQNLLGIRWFNPYDEDNEVELTLVNYKKDTGKTVPEIVPPVTSVNNNTSNSYLLIVLLSVLGFSLSLKRRFN